jgi:hypothetical protein
MPLLAVAPLSPLVALARDGSRAIARRRGIPMAFANITLLKGGYRCFRAADIFVNRV